MEKSMEKLSDEVAANFKEVVADTEALLKATANQGGEKLAEIRAKAEKSLSVVKAKMSETEAELLAKTKAAAKATDEYVHENPWNAIGVAAGVGILIGFFIGRR
jgi:ElaB/YqjD/DUF883 family membrane-anchored ribosome-binding protein